MSVDWSVTVTLVGTGKSVKFAPLTAGSVAGNLPFGISPDPRLSAFNEVNPIPEP